MNPDEPSTVARLIAGRSDDVVFRPLALAGAYVVEVQPHHDHRGSYTQTFNAREFAANGLAESFVEAGISRNARRGTLRGMHMQLAPHSQAKLVRCSRGSIHDVIVDLRPESATHGEWVGQALSEETGDLLYVPQGFAHGFQTLEDDVEVTYLLSAHHNPGSEFGVRWDDPRFAIKWPIEEIVISDRDRSFADYTG